MAKYDDAVDRRGAWRERTGVQPLQALPIPKATRRRESLDERRRASGRRRGAPAWTLAARRRVPPRVREVRASNGVHGEGHRAEHDIRLKAALARDRAVNVTPRCTACVRYFARRLARQLVPRHLASGAPSERSTREHAPLPCVRRGLPLHGASSPPTSRSRGPHGTPRARALELSRRLLD